MAIFLVVLSLGIPIPFCGDDDKKDTGSTDNELSTTIPEIQDPPADGNPEADTDADGIPDSNDNCPAVSNPDQHDSDDPPNAIGDACQDLDTDGIIDNEDNCKDTVNKDQANADGDSEGDACDTDKDNDGISDSEDKCPYNDENTCNPDVDKDEDGIANDLDNCSDIQSKMGKTTECIEKRLEIMHVCFKGGDGVHWNQIQQELKGLDNCATCLAKVQAKQCRP